MLRENAVLATRLRVVLLAVLAVGALAARAGDPPPVTPVEAPRHVSYDSDRGPLLLGPVEAADILAAFPDWPEELEGWQPDAAAVAELAAVTTPTDILCVMGTWCGDSQREVPRFWRLLADAGNPNLRLNMVAVGRTGDDGADRVLADLGLGGDYRAEYGIEKVPTFIFSQEGLEVGRIVETPVVSLAADAAGILR
jgi:hypothetical protein